MIVKDNKKINPIISDKEAKTTKVNLQTTDGKTFGEISASAYSAIRGDYLDKYSPIDDNEKKVLDNYRKYMESLYPETKTETKAETKKDGFLPWLGKQVTAGAGQFNKAFFSSLDLILPTDFLGRYDFISNLNNYYSNLGNRQAQEAAKSSNSRGNGWNVAGEVIAATVAALPNAVLAYLSAGVSLGSQGAATGLQAGTAATSITGNSVKQMLGNAVKTTAKNPMYWSSFLQTVGNDYEEAKANGANDFVASSTAVLTSLINAGVEVAGGIENLPTSVKQGGKKAVLEWVKSSLDEGKEEVIQGIITNSIAKMAYDSDRQVFNPKESAKEFAMGTAVGGILGGAQTALGVISNNVITNKRSNPTVSTAVTPLRNTKKPNQNINGYNTKNGDISKTDITTNDNIVSDELSELMNTEPAKRYTPENASDDVKRLENLLIERGADDVSRQNIINTALSIEQTLVGTDKTLKNVFDDVAKTTSEAVRQTQIETEAPVSYWNLFSENFKAAAVDDISSAPVSVGDTFKDAKTGNTITVVERDAENTTVEIDTGAKTETREFTNSQADSFATNEQFEQMESSETLSPEDAQKYNIVVSNLKKKAEELGLLDNNFFTALQNVNLYNPSASDRAAISTEFRRVFAGNTDPLVTSWLDSISVAAQPVTSINEQNMPVSTENTPVNDGVTNIDVDMAEGEILSLKHTKNIYSVFKDSKKVVVGDGIITDGRFGLPLTDKNLEAVKKVYDGEITEMQNIKMSKFYNPNNDVIIHGNPIVDDTTETIFYVFNIDGKYYVAQQKYIDAVNKKGNVIKANSQSVAIPWTVHDGEGNLIAILCGAKPSKNADVAHSNKQTVKDVLEMNRQKKEAKAAEKAEADRRNAEFEESTAQKRNAELERRKSLSTPEEINSLKEKYEGKEFTDGENTYRVIYHPDRAWFEFAIVQEDGSLEHFGAELIEPSSAAMEQKISLLEKFRQNNAKNKELARIEKEKRAEAQAKKDEEEKHINSYVSGMKPMTAAKIKNTLLKDFGADVKLHKFVENAVKNGQRLEAKDVNGKKSYRLYKDGSLYYEINKTAYDYGKYIESILKDAESGIKSEKTVAEIPESVMKKADSATEMPDTEKITVGMDDETRAELLNKKSINVVSFDAEKAKAIGDIDFDALQNSYPSYARPIIKKIAKDFGILNESFYNSDIELEFNYSGGSIQESINKQHSRYGDFVKMLSVFSDVIENAVGVETHKDKYFRTRREDTNLKQMYVLASAFSDEKGVYPVKLEVKEFNDKANKLYLSVVLTKKESRYLSGNLGQNQLNTAPPAFTISIADLVGIVNPSEGDFLKYFPDSMLDSEQIEGKNKALAKDVEKLEKLTGDKKIEPLAWNSDKQSVYSINALGSNADIVSQDNDIVNSSVRTDAENDTSKVYDVAYFDDLGAAIRKGESVSLEDVRTAVDAILMNHGETIKAELSQLKNDELKKRISIYNRGRITKKAEMVDSIYTDMLSSLYYALSGKDTITYIYDGTGFDAQQSKMLFDISRELTEETFSKRLTDNAEKYKKQVAAREEKLAKVKNPQTLEDYAYKKHYFGLSDEETIQYENLYAEERRKAREDKKAAKTTKDTSGAESFFANTDNYTIEKTTHTKTGEDVWVVRPASRLETEQWKQLNEQMKALGGSYWRGNQGWNFKKDPTAALSSAEEIETAKGSTSAEKLRAVAEGMQKAIDDKFRDRLTNTAKRAREAASAEAEGERLKRLQDTINNIADALENGENTLLDKIDSKAQVETLMSMLRTGRRNRISETLPDITYDELLQEQDKPYSNDDAKYAEYPLTKLHESVITEYIRAVEGKTGYKQITNRLKKSLKSVKNGYVTVDAQMFADMDKIVQNLSTYRADFWNDGVSERKRLARMGIENVVELRAYLREFINFLPGRNIEAEKQRAIKEKERQLANAKIEGFFPTPKAIVEKMLDEADIKPGEKVLEPSAGKGNIADEIKAKYPDNALDVVEWNASLNELLTEKGYNVVAVDFLQHSGEYDKIIMNPPFEKGRDIDHIRHAYSLLNDGGRVVCIMSEGPFYRSDKKATEFREWLDSLGGVSEKLPEGAFKVSERSTGVNTRLVVVDKANQKNNQDESPKVLTSEEMKQLKEKQKQGEELTLFERRSIQKTLYGNKTHDREITSQTYESAQKRLKKDVDNFLGVKGSRDLAPSKKSEVANDAKSTNRNAVLLATKKTLKSEITSNANLMGMLSNKFGGDGIYGLVDELIMHYNKDGTIGDFENLFIDRGEEIYDALRNQENKNAKYYISERGVFLSGQTGNNLLLRNSRRQLDASTGEQTRKLQDFKRKNQGKTDAERKATTKKLFEKGQTHQEIISTEKGKIRINVINADNYDIDMKSVADKFKEDGVETILFVGKCEKAFDSNKRLNIDGFVIDDKVYLRYDGKIAPQILKMHEMIHFRWNTTKVQNAKEGILSKMTKEQISSILNEPRYLDYAEIYGDDADAILEEFVADVLSGVNIHTEKYIDMVSAYWNGEKYIDNYKVSEYTESIDSGGTDDKFRLSFGYDVSYREKRQLEEYIISRNNRGDILKTIDCKEIGNNFYIWKNISKTDYEILGTVEIEGNEDDIDFLRSEINGINRGKRKISDLYQSFNERNRNGDRSGFVDKDKYSNASNDRLFARASSGGKTDGDRRRNSGTSIGDTSESEVKFSVASNAEFWTEWLNKAKEYGIIPGGENPTRDIDVPQKITQDKLVSRFARTMLEAGVTPDTAVSEFEKHVLDGTMTHEVITNNSAREWAVNKIKYHGFEEALNTWSVYTRDGNVGKKELALGMELYNQCITSGDVTNAMKIAAELVAEATHAGQTLQATRMLKLMTPDGQLYYLEKSIQKMNDEFKKKIGDKYEDIELNKELMKKFLTEKEADKRDEIYDDICQDIADQIPPTLLDKWNSWRYLAMLGNPRTHIRNIAGNAVFTPAIKLKNYIGAVIEKVAKVDTDKRTKSLYKNKKAVEFAKNDFAKMLKVLQGENAKYAVTSDIEGKRTIFKTKWLEKLRTKNFEWLEKEDMWFLKRHYVDALAQIITARTFDVDSLDEKTLDIARAYAVREAQRATYRDANSIAEALNKMQKKASHSDKKAVRAANLLIEGVMPFKKTPLNIAKQGVQYSPVGILTGVYKTVSKIKNGDAYSTTDVIDDFAKGLTGTALMLLGTLLASLGIISGGDDENKKKKEFDKMVGEQSFSINIGDKSYTIDWAAPTCLPLFTGVELYDLTKDDFKFSDITVALSSLTDPLLELSVFSGISGAIESTRYNDTNTLFAIGSDMTTSYITQALPTIGGQISRIIDGNKREYYYTDKNSSLPKGLQNFIGQVASKIPFASYLFEPSIDEWGREETYGGILERTLENVVSPGYYSEKNYTEVDEEIKRLYESTGNTDVLPVIQQKKYTADYIDYPMTAAQYTEAKKLRGQKSFELIEQLLSNRMSVKLQNKQTGEYQTMTYSVMSDEERVRAIKKCYEQAGDETKEIMFEDVKGNR